jgi:hypothetical protein
MISDDINYRHRTDLEPTDTNMEVVVIELVQPNTSSLILMFVYRLDYFYTYHHWLPLFTEFLDSLPLENSRCAVLGDFNVDLMQSDTADANSLMSLMSNCGFQQLINEPTRVTHQSRTILDHIYTTDPQLMFDAKVFNSEMSDHYPTAVSYCRRTAGSKKCHTTIKYRSMTDFNQEVFLQDLKHVPWNLVEIFDDPNDALGVWMHLFFEVLDQHVPLKERRVKSAKLPEWWSTDIADAIKLRDSTNKLQDPEMFKTRRKDVTKKINQAKQDYFCALLDIGRTAVHLFWKHFKEVLPSRLQTSPLELCVDGSVATTPAEIAAVFNDHFSTVAEKLLHDQSCDPDLTKLCNFINSKIPDDTMFDIPDFTVSDVNKNITQLNVKKSTGIDGLPARFLVMSADIISPSITYILNMSLHAGIFPSIWKTAKVSALFKKGPLNNPDNYRPISILPTLSKIFERHVHSHLTAFLTSYDLLCKTQSGFRSFHSCQTALTSLVDSWAFDIDKNNLVGILLID